MTRHIASVFILAFTLTISFGQNKNQYEIIGSASGIKDYTVLYLDFTDGNDKILDSTYVVGEKF